MAAASSSGAAVALPGLLAQGGSNGHAADSHSSHKPLAKNYLYSEYCMPHLSQALHYVLSTFVCDSTNITSSTSQAPFQRRRSCKQLRIADVGCGSGPNTLEHAHFVVQAILEGAFVDMSHDVDKHSGSAHDIALQLSDQHPYIELQYFFSDLPENDFNCLFRSLQPIGPQLQNFVDLRSSAAAQNISVFAAGVPGSFYGRLFLQDSLHLAVCNFSLHWLSQVPLSVVDRNSEAWNGGHAWINGGRPKVCEAYAHQFQTDAKAFLKCRAQELVRGGILFIIAVCRSELHPPAFFQHDNDLWIEDLDSCWQDMLDEGVVSEEERDMFNIPFYNFHWSELEAAVQVLQKEGMDVEIVKMEVMEKCNKRPLSLSQQLASNKEAYGKARTSEFASLMKPLVHAYLGEERAEHLFKRIESKVSERANPFPPTFDVIVATIRRL